MQSIWPFIGPFLKFLDKTGIMKEFGKIAGTWTRQMLKPQIFILLYILKIIVGIPTTRGSEALLGDLGAMNLVGFNVDNLMNGLCNRGDANQHGNSYKKISCAMDVFTVLYNIEKCCKSSAMEAFNRIIRSMRGMLQGGTYALDSTIIQTKPDFPGCGKTKRKKEGHSGDLPNDYEYIYGFKLFAL